MGEARGGARLAVEPPGDLGVRRHVRVEDLEGDLLVEPDLSRRVDAAHRTFPDDPVDQVFAGDGAPDEGVVALGHVERARADDALSGGGEVLRAAFRA